MRRYLSTGRNRSTVQSDARSTRRAISGDFSSIRSKVCCRVFGGDSALQSKAVHSYGFLAQPEILKGFTRGNAHLRLHKIDIRDFFGNCVLDLDSWVHLNKDVLALVRANRVDQKFDGSRILITKLLGKANRIGIKLLL